MAPPTSRELAARLERLGERDDVHRLAALIQLDHGVHDLAVRLAIEIVRREQLDGAVERRVVEQDAAEHRFLCLEALRRHATEVLVDRSHLTPQPTFAPSHPQLGRPSQHEVGSPTTPPRASARPERRKSGPLDALVQELFDGATVVMRQSSGVAWRRRRFEHEKAPQDKPVTAPHTSIKSGPMRVPFGGAPRRRFSSITFLPSRQAAPDARHRRRRGLAEPDLQHGPSAPKRRAPEPRVGIHHPGLPDALQYRQIRDRVRVEVAPG